MLPVEWLRNADESKEVMAVMHLQELGDRLVEALSASPCMVSVGNFQGLYLQASMLGNDVVIFHNLSATGSRPTQAQVFQMLNVAESTGKLLCEVSTAFQAFMTGRRLVTQVVVFSGHWDLLVATRRGVDIEWHETLEKGV